MATAVFVTQKEKLMRSRSTSYDMRMRNVEKHFRLARATKGTEQIVHKIKANKFAVRYGIGKLFEI